MTARVERYIEYDKIWVYHNDLPEGTRVKGIVPDSSVVFEAPMLSVGKGFTTVIEGKEEPIPVGHPSVEYWRKNHMKKKQVTKFRLIPT